MNIARMKPDPIVANITVAAMAPGETGISDPDDGARVGENVGLEGSIVPKIVDGVGRRVGVWLSVENIRQTSKIATQALVECATVITGESIAIAILNFSSLTPLLTSGRDIKISGSAIFYGRKQNYI